MESKIVNSSDIPPMSVTEFCEKLWGCKVSERFQDKVPLDNVVQFPVKYREWEKPQEDPSK